MRKKWKISMHELRQRVRGQGIYIVPPEGRKFMIRIEIIGVYQYVIDEERVEFINYSPEGEEEFNSIPRTCLEELALTGHSHDKELNVDYYTDEALPKRIKKPNQNQ